MWLAFLFTFELCAIVSHFKSIGCFVAFVILLTSVSRDHIKIDRGVLRIVNARLEDKGMYVCMARNPNGTITTQSFVDVQGMTLLTKTPFTRRRIQINLMCYFIPC